MEAIFDLQRSLYSGAIVALHDLPATGMAGLPALVAAAFGFGMLHALLPGHGKSVLASHYAGDGRWVSALASTTILIVTHVGSAIVLVLTGFIVLQRTIGGAGRAPIVEHASQLLITVVGLSLLWRALRPHAHGHDRSGPVLAVVTGMVPCPLTTFIMTYATAHGVIVAGLVLSAMFAAGMTVTVAAFPLLAVMMRARLLPAMVRSESWRKRAGGSLELASALAVTACGLWPLLQGRLLTAG